MDFLDLIPTVFSKTVAELSPGRLVEGLVLLSFLWRKVKPHLEALEKRLEGLEKAVQDGFKSGDSRFLRIEERVTALEENHKAKGGIGEINCVV